MLREESKKGNNFDLNKIISIFDSSETYEKINERYPELTDDLLHLMPTNYSKIQLGQLISAIWSKYLSLQGGDVETQKQFLAKDKEIFQKEKEISELKLELNGIKENNPNSSKNESFRQYLDSGKLNQFISKQQKILTSSLIDTIEVPEVDVERAFGLIDQSGYHVTISEKGREFFEWLILNKK